MHTAWRNAVDRRIKQAHEEYVHGDTDAHLLLRRIRHVMRVSLELIIPIGKHRMLVISS